MSAAVRRVEATFDWCAEKFCEHPEQYERVAATLRQEIDKREREIAEVHEEIRAEQKADPGAYVADLTERLRRLSEGPQLLPATPLQLQRWWTGGLVEEIRRGKRKGEAEAPPIERRMVRPPIRQLAEDYAAAQERAIDAEITTARRQIRKNAGANGRRQGNVLLWQQIALTNLAQKMAGAGGLNEKLIECVEVMVAQFTKEKPNLNFDKAHDWALKIMRIMGKIGDLQAAGAEAEARVTGQSRSELLSQGLPGDENGGGAGSGADLAPEALAGVLRDQADAMDGIAQVERVADTVTNPADVVPSSA